MRSKLFVPSVRPDLFLKATSSGADAVCFDLEEGVPTDRKAEARENLSASLRTFNSAGHPALLVRVNRAASDNLQLDIEAVAGSHLAAIALPKVETIEEITLVDELLTKIERERGLIDPIALLVTIESPRGLRCAAELAQSSPRVIGLQLGFADLFEPLGISSTDALARNNVRLMLRLAAAEANVDCYESAYPLFRDEPGFLAQLEDARSLGFAGASCIHPSQIGPANRVFAPTVEEIQYAKGVLNAAEETSRQGSAIAQYNGKMIDAPFLLRARSILAASGLH
ncbi:HpcH/HpaI aldolase/citrate lyase family protein [Terracidiphilus gabretensis]|uniref:HpcH/HpaI aldolase/citrate lyase family protein n=1 Tax=Terracidiphilus gabretensis TaxID=1577687 RepID=UPI00071B3E05|nr:CoA ester lyase [Terracidiphilus gabretensis]